MAGNSFGARAGLDVGDRSLEVFRLDALGSVGDVGGLPFSLQVLLVNLLRNEDGSVVTAEDVEAFARWDPEAAEDREIAFSPARVLMQDFTGVPAIVDLAAMRDAMEELGGDATKINPLVPVELVIDHRSRLRSNSSSAFRWKASRSANTSKRAAGGGDRFSRGVRAVIAEQHGSKDFFGDYVHRVALSSSSRRVLNLRRPALCRGNLRHPRQARGGRHGHDRQRCSSREHAGDRAEQGRA